MNVEFPFNLTPEQAVAWFKEKVALSPKAYKTLSAELKRKAFTFASISDLDTLNIILKSLQNAVALGIPFPEWQAAMKEFLPTWNKNHLKIVYQTNTQSAYQAGRYAALTQPETLAARPYWVFSAVLDSRTSSQCRSLHGVTLPHDHPFWSNNFPPRHFGCRSTVRSLSSRQAEGKTTAQAPDVKADKGFGHRPDTSEWKPEWSKYPPELQAAKALKGKMVQEDRS